MLDSAHRDREVEEEEHNQVCAQSAPCAGVVDQGLASAVGGG
jgi:hypothetical protein